MMERRRGSGGRKSKCTVGLRFVNQMMTTAVFRATDVEMDSLS